MSRRRINNCTLELLDGENELVLSVFEFLRGDVMVIELKGKIRNEIAHDLEDEIDAASFACSSLEIDLGNVTYIAGMGLEVFCEIKREIDTCGGAEIILTNVSEETAVLLREAGYSGKIEIREQDTRG
jgi:anti-anti-sigma factor